MLTACLAVVGNAATIKPGKTYFGSLMGEKGAGFKFYYSTTPKTESPLKDRVALNMLISNKDPWPWPEGMNYYAEKADGTNAVVGIAVDANRIALTTYIKDDAIRRPMIAFTAPADGDYSFSMSARLLWSPTEIGIEVWVNGVKTDKYFVAESGGEFKGTVSLKEGQELTFATVNHAWPSAENTLLLENLSVKYEGDPNAPADTSTSDTEPTPPPVQSSTESDTPVEPPVQSSTESDDPVDPPVQTTEKDDVTTDPEPPVQTTDPDVTEGEGKDGDGVGVGAVIGIAAASAVVGAAIGSVITACVLKKKKS